MMSRRLRAIASDRRHDLIVLLGYLALTAGFYAPILLGLRWFPTGDFTDHFLPFSLFQRAEILAGRLPVWNPYTFSGHPFLADIQAAVFYPISNLVLGLTLPWGGAMSRLYWLQVEAILQIALAGFFTYLLARDLVRSRAAAFLAGCLFAFSGYLTGYPALQTAVLRTAIWLPLVLWCLRRAFADRAAWRWWIAAALAYAIAFLGGHPQTFLFLSYCVAGWIVMLLATGARRDRLPKVAAFYAIFLGLSAAQLWPSLEFTSLSVRSGMDYASASGGFPLKDTWQLFAPGVRSQFSPLFVGILALGLAVLAAVLGIASLSGNRPNFSEGEGGAASPATHAARAPLFFVIVAVAALLASYGDNGFLYPILYRLAPGWSMFRGQERAAYLVAFGLSVAAAYGAAAFFALPQRTRRAALLVWIAITAAALIAIDVLLGPTLDANGQAAWLRSRLAGGAVLIVMLVLAVRTLPRRTMAALVTMTVLFELVVANAGTNLSSRPVLPQAEAVALQAIVAGSGGAAPPRVQNEHLLPEDYGMLARVEDVNGTSPLRLARYDALLRDFPQARLWQLTGTQYVLTTRNDLYAASQVVAGLPGAPSVGAILADATAGADPSLIHQLAESHPRAWVVNSLATADDASAPARLGDGNLNLAQTALLPPAVNGSGRPIGLEDGTLSNAGSSEARVEQIAPGHLRIHVQSEYGGYLVVSENWLPGWRATVREGNPSTAPDSTRQASPVGAPVLRTNLTFLGLPLTAGESTVELVYRPASVQGGLLISGLTLLLLAGALAVRRGRANLLGHRINRPGFRSLGGLAPRLADLGDLAAPAAVLVAFALRTFRLGYQELRGDEALGRLFSMESLPTLVRQTIELAEPHPVASYVVQGEWLKLAGHTEFALRFVSAWFGVLAVALIYRLARRLGLGRSVAALAGVLLAVSPYAIWHSQDARMYSISLALTLGSTVLMLEALARASAAGVAGQPARQTRGRAVTAAWWGAYVAVTWLALQTHYYAAYIIVVQNLFVFGRAIAGGTERRRLPQWVAAQAVTFVLYLPWLIAARSTLTGYVGNGDSPGFASMWLRSLGVFAVGETMPADQRAAAGIVIAVLAVAGALGLARSAAGRRSLWLLTPYLIAPLLITWAGALSRPIFNERYIIAALPGLLLMVAGVAARRHPEPDRLPVNGQATEQRPLKRADTEQPESTSPVYGASLRSPDINVRAGGTPDHPAPGGGGAASWSPLHERNPDVHDVRAVVAVLLAILLVATLASLLHYYDDPAYSKSRGWRQLAAVLDRHSRSWRGSEVRVAQTYPDPTLWYYVTSDAEHLVLPPAAHDEDGARTLVNQLAAQDVQRVVVAVQPSESWDDREIASRTLAEAYRLIGETPVGDWRVQVYDRPPAELAAVRTVFGNGLQLVGVTVPGEHLSPGDVVPVYLQWQGEAQGLSGNEKITLQLLDAGSKVIAQLDQPFGQADLGATKASYSLFLPRILPGGSYYLIAALYDPSIEGAPRLLTLDGRDHVVLKELQAHGIED